MTRKLSDTGMTKREVALLAVHQHLIVLYQKAHLSDGGAFREHIEGQFNLRLTDKQWASITGHIIKIISPMHARTEHAIDAMQKRQDEKERAKNMRRVNA